MHTDGQTYGRNDDNRRHEKRAPSCFQTEQAQGFVLGKYHASSRELCTSCIYFILPEAKKTTLKFLFRFLRP